MGRNSGRAEKRSAFRHLRGGRKLVIGPDDSEMLRQSTKLKLAKTAIAKGAALFRPTRWKFATMVELYPTLCGPLFVAWCASAAPVPPINVPQLIQDSDIIVAGMYGETVVEAHALTRPHIHIDNILKGSPHLDLGAIHFKILEDKYILPPRSGLFFLARPTLR